MKTINFNAEELFGRFGYKYYVSHYSVNIYAIRKNNPELNKFDDYLFLDFMDYDLKCHFTYRYNCTTVPGDDFLDDKMSNKDGTFILLPSTVNHGRQYKFKTGVMHKGKYECLGEKEPVIGYRDNNKDGKLTLDYDDESRLFENTNGTIHIHKAGLNSTLVDRWSAGCQVFAFSYDWNNFMYNIKRSESFYGNTFTYTLFQESDLTKEELDILIKD